MEAPLLPMDCMAMTPALNDSLWLALPASQRSRFDKPPLPEAFRDDGERTDQLRPAWADHNHHAVPSPLDSMLGWVFLFLFSWPSRPSFVQYCVDQEAQTNLSPTRVFWAQSHMVEEPLMNDIT